MAEPTIRDIYESLNEDQLFLLEFMVTVALYTDKSRRLSGSRQ